MPTMIDHLVIVDQRLDVMIEQARALGFTVVPGGEHAGGMTHNALIAFADGTYIELIAFIDPEQRSSHRWWPRLWKGGGLADFALLSADLRADVEAIAGRGMTLPEPEGNGRLRPDGERLEWLGLMTQAVVGDSGLPFLIEDVTPRSLRVPHGDEAPSHANGATGVAGVTLLVEDAVAAAAALAAITGTAIIQVPPFAPGITAARRLEIGTELGQWVVLAQPDLSKFDEVEATGLPAKYLEKYGHGPFGAVLTTDADPRTLGPDSGEELDLSLLGAPRLRLA